MKTVSIRDARNRLTELARDVEAGETVVVTRNGKPILDLVPHRRTGGIDFDAVAAFHKEHGGPIIEYDPDTFDDPLPEDILIRPLPD